MGEKGRVLVVDDESALREIMTLLLEDAGFDVVTAHSGNSALSILDDSNNFYAIISDIKMRDGDGIYLMEEIQKRGLSIERKILITGYSQISEEEAFEAGAHQLLRKPADIDTVLASLAK